MLSSTPFLVKGREEEREVESCDLRKDEGYTLRLVRVFGGSQSCIQAVGYVNSKHIMARKII